MGSGFVRITAFVATFVAFSAQGAQDVLITQTVDRSNSVYHRQGYAAVAPEVTDSIGGVLSQAAVVADQINPVSVVFPDVEGTRDPGYILVRRGLTEARLPIAYSDLVPIALFVDGRATALFTLHSPLPKGFERSAGFVRSDVRGRIALEFRGTRFENPLYSADRDSADRDGPLFGQNEPTLVTAANAGLRAFGLMIPANLQRNWSYINTDVGRTYTLALDHERAEISGGIVRYSWRVTGTGDRQNYEIVEAIPLFNRAAVEQAAGAARSRTTQAWQTLRSAVENLNRELARSPSTVPSNDVVRQFSQQTFSIIRQQMSIMRKEQGREANLNETLGSATSYLHTFTLFEKLALLRRARDDSPESFQRFMSDIRNLAEREGFRPAWLLYTESFCRVYDDDPRCARRHSN